ncbi:MAG: peptidylprolyl isomerase [Desulfatibacillaceae bacterium]
MNLLKNRGRHIALAVVILLVAATGTMAQDAAQSNGAVAEVNGEPITRQEFDQTMMQIQQQAMRMGQEVGEAQLAMMRADVLEKLVANELLYQESRKQGIEIAEETVDKIHGEMIDQKFKTREQYEQQLDKAGLSDRYVRRGIRRGMAVEKLIKERYTPKVEVTDEEIRAFYEKNKDKFKAPEQVEARHILIKVDDSEDKAARAEARKRIEEVQNKLEGGGDFAALAKEYSDCPSASKGGNLGSFDRNRMVKPFEEAAFSLKTGERSDIVETRFGYHIIEVTGRRDEGVVAFEDVKDRIADYLQNQEISQLLKEEVAQLKQKADIKTHIDVAENQGAPATPAE